MDKTPVVSKQELSGFFICLALDVFKLNTRGGSLLEYDGGFSLWQVCVVQAPNTFYCSSCTGNNAKTGLTCRVNDLT